jgi:hypothetical protein
MMGPMYAIDVLTWEKLNMFEFKDDEPPNVALELSRLKEMLRNIESMNIDVIRKLCKDMAAMQARIRLLEAND